MNFRLLFFWTIFTLIGCGVPAEEKNNKRPPNILIFLADDMGYSDLGCFGSNIQTPNLDKLAAEGIRFTQFYNCAKCTPSRGALLTGRYPHEVGVGGPIAMPGRNYKKGAYQGYLATETPTFAEFFKAQGYRTGMSGKWHVGEAKEHWPHRRGFDKYFGLISGASSYFEKLNEKRIRHFAIDSTEWTPPNQDFYLTDAIADYAIQHLEQHLQKNPQQPFLEYVAFTAPHWPLHAHDSDIEKYAGKYDAGWAATRQKRYENLQKLNLLAALPALPPPPISIPNWEERDTLKNWARRMEVHAAMVDRMDQNIGRIIQLLKKKGQFDNTIIIFLADNGASAESIEGRKLHDANVPIGLQGSYVAFQEPWANAVNVPLREYKLKLYEGGISTPFIIHWGNALANRKGWESGSIRHQPTHLVDIFPSIIEWSNLNSNQLELSGLSLERFIVNLETEERPIFWEYNQHQAMRLGDWKLIKPNEGKWQLYNMANDRSEQQDLTQKYPAKVNEMAAIWEKWARRVGVYNKR